jgi:hypothetical protein
MTQQPAKRIPQWLTIDLLVITGDYRVRGLDCSVKRAAWTQITPHNRGRESRRVHLLPGLEPAANGRLSFAPHFSDSARAVHAFSLMAATHLAPPQRLSVRQIRLLLMRYRPRLARYSLRIVRSARPL